MHSKSFGLEHVGFNNWFVGLRFNIHTETCRKSTIVSCQCGVIAPSYDRTRNHKFAGPTAQWRARSRVLVFWLFGWSPPTPPVGTWGRACAPPMRAMEPWAVHFSIIFSIRFWTRFWTRLGSVLGSSWAPFGTLLGAQIGSSWAKIASWTVICSKMTMFKKHWKNQCEITKNAKRAKRGSFLFYFI